MMPHLVNIAYVGGTHGNFLKFIIDKYSKKTPLLDGLPFTDIGTSHAPLRYSGLVNSYHPRSGWQNKDEPHIIIEFDKEDILYITRLIYRRAGDIKTDWTKDYISFPKVWHDWFDEKSKIEKLYNFTFDEDTAVPKFILRDFFKLSFLDIDNHGLSYFRNHLLNHDLENSVSMKFNDFYDINRLLEALSDIDKKHNLELEIDKAEIKQIHDIFLSKLDMHNSRDRAKQIFDAVCNNEDTQINLDGIEEAWLNAQLEMKYDFIQMPNINHYFKNTKDIRKFIDWYPNHYKAMNPNLPTFNNIPNPFYLHKNKK